MTYEIKESYSEELQNHGFKKGVKFSHTVHFRNEGTGVDLYLSTAKKTNNRSVIVHPGYERSIHSLTNNSSIELVEQDEYYFRDLSLTKFPRKSFQLGKTTRSYYGIELQLVNSDIIEILCEL